MTRRTSAVALMCAGVASGVGTGFVVAGLGGALGVLAVACVALSLLLGWDD